MTLPIYRFQSSLGSVTGKTAAPGAYLKSGADFVNAVFEIPGVKSIAFTVNELTDHISLIERIDPLTAEVDVESFVKKVFPYLKGASLRDQTTINLTTGKVIEFTKWFFSAILVTYEGRTAWIREDGTFSRGSGK